MNEKCAGLLGEKFRGLSRGLLPGGDNETSTDDETHKRDTNTGVTVV